MNILKDSYIKWYKLAKATVGKSELVPERSDAEIIKNVSLDNWLNISPANDKEDAANSENPNIFFSIHKGGKGAIGVVYNNVASMDKIKNILSGTCTEQKKQLINVMKDLNSSWETTLYRKIKKSHFSQTPEDEEVYNIYANELDDESITKLFTKSQRIRQEGKAKSEELKEDGKYYCETPKLNLVECDFILTEDEFKKRILIAHEILGICYQVKTDSQIRRMVEKKRKELEKKMKELKSLIKVTKLDSKILPKEVSDKRKAKISILKNGITDLENEIKKIDEDLL